MSVRRSIRRSVTPSLKRLLGASYAEYSALFISSASVGACGCVCLSVCMKRVPGCFLIHSDIISDQNSVFADFWKTPDGRTDRQTDPLMDLYKILYHETVPIRKTHTNPRAYTHTNVRPKLQISGSPIPMTGNSKKDTITHTQNCHRNQ